jgi:hypothetical protein
MSFWEGRNTEYLPQTVNSVKRSRPTADDNKAFLTHFVAGVEQRRLSVFIFLESVCGICCDVNLSILDVSLEGMNSSWCRSVLFQLLVNAQYGHPGRCIPISPVQTLKQAKGQANFEVHSEANKDGACLRAKDYRKCHGHYGYLYVCYTYQTTRPSDVKTPLARGAP